MLKQICSTQKAGVQGKNSGTETADRAAAMRFGTQDDTLVHLLLARLPAIRDPEEQWESSVPAEGYDDEIDGTLLHGIYEVRCRGAEATPTWLVFALQILKDIHGIFPTKRIFGEGISEAGAARMTGAAQRFQPPGSSEHASRVNKWQVASAANLLVANNVKIAAYNPACGMQSDPPAPSSLNPLIRLQRMQYSMAVLQLAAVNKGMVVHALFGL